MTSPPANDYEMDEFVKVVTRKAAERYQTNVLTHTQAELTVNLLVVAGKLPTSRMGMVGFVREVAALALFIADEVFDDDGNVKFDFPRAGDQLDPQAFKQTEHLGKHAGIKEFLDAPLTSCRGFVPMAGFGETRCKSCGRPKDQHPVRVQ